MDSHLTKDSLFDYLISRVADVKALKVSLTLISMIDDNEPKPIGENYLINHDILNEGLLLNKHSIRTGINSALQDKAIIKMYNQNDESKQPFYTVNLKPWLKAANLLGYYAEASTDSTSQKPTISTELINEQINIYRLYEQHIGTITPSVSEELKEAEGLYDPQWITEAFKIALASEKNNWRYISTILSRWNLEGKKDGKFRRHIKETDNNKYITEYRRLRNRDPERS